MKNVLHSNRSIFLAIVISLITLQVSTILQAKQTLDELASFYQNVPVLVTGGCGFIGSHLVEKLVAYGAQVTILDDLSSGSANNIAAVADKVTLLKGSITNFETCLAATENKAIIFHLAAFISVPESTEKPHTCHEINVLGTQNLLEAARINHVKRFVFSSTCATYGDSQSECHETTPTAPTSPYGFSKLIGEIYCKEYAQVFDMETVAMRYFNVYGARQNPHSSYAGVIAKFSYNMEHNLPLIIFGDGMQTRDYVPVKKIIEANIFLGMIDKDYVQGKLFNIATGKSITILELINILKEQYPSYNEKIIFMPPRPGDVKHVSANCAEYDTLCNTLLNK